MFVCRNIMCEICTSTGYNLETDLEIVDEEDGCYTVYYTPDRVGIDEEEIEVKIEVNGKPLDDSPCSVVVIPMYQYDFEFSLTGNGPGQFNTPYDIAISEETGTIAVFDYGNKRIQLFDSNGRYLREIGLRANCTS